MFSLVSEHHSFPTPYLQLASHKISKGITAPVIKTSSHVKLGEAYPIFRQMIFKMFYKILLSLLFLVLNSYQFSLYAENDQSIFDAVLRGHLDFSSDPWPSVSSSAKDLVKKMLRSDPRERISAAEVLSKIQL